MKNLIRIYIIIFIAFQSCTDNRLEGMHEDKAYFVKSGKNEISGFLSEDKMELVIPVYRSGVENQKIDVQLLLDESALAKYTNSEGEKYKVLPADYYTLGDTKFTFEGDQRLAQTKIVLDIKKINSVQGVLDEKYAIPLVIKSNDVTIGTKQGEMLVVPILTGGIKPSSTEVLWSKTFADLGISAVDHFTASLAVSSQYVFINTRNADLRYYDRFSGAYIGTIPLSFKGGLTNFTVVNDNADNLLISNLRNAATGLALQTIYKISGTGTPQVFIAANHEYPNGRKLSVVGNLNTDAIITSSVENSSKILYWEVKQGVVVNQMPKVITLDVTKINWRNFGDAIPRTMNINDGLFAIGNGTISGFGYFQADGTMSGTINLALLGFPVENANTFQSLADVTFNGARYLAFANQSGQSQMYAGLLDVTKPSLITVNNSSSLLKYKSAPMTTLNNANVTADVQVRLADDHKSFIMYALGTNGSVVATKFAD